VIIRRPRPTSVILNSFQDPAVHESGLSPLSGGC
jgi:hypothetical protein